MCNQARNISENFANLYSTLKVPHLENFLDLPMHTTLKSLMDFHISISLTLQYSIHSHSIHYLFIKKKMQGPHKLHSTLYGRSTPLPFNLSFNAFNSHRECPYWYESVPVCKLILVHVSKKLGPVLRFVRTSRCTCSIWLWKRKWNYVVLTRTIGGFQVFS